MSLWKDFPDETGCLRGALAVVRPPTRETAPDEVDRVADELERQAGVLRHLAAVLREVQ